MIITLVDVCAGARAAGVGAAARVHHELLAALAVVVQCEVWVPAEFVRTVATIAKGAVLRSMANTDALAGRGAGVSDSTSVREAENTSEHL